MSVAAVSPSARSAMLRHGLAAVTLSDAPGVAANAAPVRNIDIRFEDGYSVRFKLPASTALADQGVDGFASGGELQPPVRLSPEQESATAAFFDAIEPRLARIRHEQEVQGITFLGNTFVLDRKTVFDVVADDDGRLTIDMHRGAERKRAVLLASALLDGLYDGSIVPWTVSPDHSE